MLFGKTAEVTSDHCGKGKLVGVGEGRIQVRNWEANDGSKRKSVEVICDNIQFLSPRGGLAMTDFGGSPPCPASGRKPLQ